MYKELKFRIKGVAPLLVHNGQLASPFNEVGIKIRAITSKQKKTEEDFRRLADLEWHGGLYLDEKQRPCIPGELIEGLLRDGGKKNRLGAKFNSGAISEGNWIIEHDGPTDLKKLWENKAFCDQRVIALSKSKRMLRTRPIFRNWELAFSVHYLSDVLDKKEVVKALEVAGRLVGLGDYRPRFGRFEII